MGRPRYPGDIVDGQQIYNYEVNVRSKPMCDNLNPSTTSGEGITSTNISETAALNKNRFNNGGLITTQGTDAQIVTSRLKQVGTPRVKVKIIDQAAGDADPDVSDATVFVWKFGALTNINFFDNGGATPASPGQIVYCKLHPEATTAPELTCQGAVYPYGAGAGSGIWAKGGVSGLAQSKEYLLMFICFDVTAEGDSRWIQVASIPA